jgi:hypothetical protein
MVGLVTCRRKKVWLIHERDAIRLGRRDAFSMAPVQPRGDQHLDPLVSFASVQHCRGRLGAPACVTGATVRARIPFANCE